MIFEIIMLVCFGLSWPFGIIKTLKSKSVKGVSLLLYLFVFIGYISGILFKIFYRFDFVIILYSINAFMVGIQIILYFYYKNKESQNTPPEWV